MRFSLLLSFVLMSIVVEAGAQARGATPAPAQTQPSGSQAKPAAPRPTTPAQPRRTTPAAAARAGMAITVTDPKGATLPGVRVEIIGPTDRSAETDASGLANFTGMQAGTYRLRFSGDEVIAFEREVTLRAGQVATVDVALNPAPEPPPPPPPPPAPEPPAAAEAGPTGQPLTLGIVELLDREFVGREPRRESLLSCSGNERSTMIQLNEPLPERLYETADVVYYVLGGEGSVTIDGRSTRIATNGFISVPRGTLHGFERRGGRPLVLLSVLSGEPCEQAK